MWVDTNIATATADRCSCSGIDINQTDSELGMSNQWLDMMDLTYSGVITATTASPVDNLLLARPKKLWKVRHPIRIGGLAFKSQHWRTYAWEPPIRTKDKENNQCSPPREQNLRDVIWELGIVGSSTWRVGLGDLEDQLILYFSAFMARRSKSLAVTFSRDLPWRPGSGRFRRIKWFWTIFNQTA